MHRAIPYPVLLVLDDGTRLYLSLVHIRWAQKETDKTVLDGEMIQAVLSRSPLIKGVVPVGNAFLRAIQTGVADANPYDGIDAGKVNLWTYDSYHASTFGYYLEALVEFGHITGRDPRSLGAKECSAYELGLSGEQASALEQVAFDQLAAEGLVKPAPLVASDKTRADRCPAWH